MLTTVPAGLDLLKTDPIKGKGQGTDTVKNILAVQAIHTGGLPQALAHPKDPHPKDPHLMSSGGSGKLRRATV